jgi:PAS domain S-box-containing protein
MNYVLTRDTKWEQRYSENLPKLNQTIAEAMASGDAIDRRYFSAIESANAVLVRAENEAIELAKNGHFEDAVKIMDSSEYWDQKNTFAQTIENYFHRRDAERDAALLSSNETVGMATGEAQNIIRTSRISISTFLMVAIILALVLGLAISHHISGALSKLKSATIEIGKGNLYTKADIKSNDEFGQLAASFTKMAEDLKKMIDNLYREIKHRTKAEAAVRKNEEEKKTILDNMSENVVYLDRENKVVWANRAAAESAGLNREDLVGRHCYEVSHGQTGPCEYCPVSEACKTGRPKTAEITSPDGRIWLVQGQPVTDTKGNLMGAVEVTAEITARKLAEDALKEVNTRLQQTVEALRQSNSQIQDVIHIATHDLKTPLRGIGTLAEWLIMDHADSFDDQGRDKIGLLVKRVKRLNKLIDGMLEYCRIEHDRSKKQRVNLNVLVKTVLDEIESPQHIEITIENDLPEVFCEKTHVAKVFQNLLGNAVKYMDKPQGLIRVGCTEEHDFWKFSVADNGAGIEHKDFERIFKIFQTLRARDEFESTGIGLTIAKKIVEMYGGRIWVESKVGKGTTFFFTLPKSPIEQKEPVAAAEAPAQAGDNG